MPNTPKGPFHWARLGVGGALLGCALYVAYAVGSANASDIPLPNPLSFSGQLLTFGVPDNSTHSMTAALFNGSTQVCITPTTSVACVNGQFALSLTPSTPSCLTAVQTYSNLGIQVTVDGTPLGINSVNAVPYAVIADNATGNLTPNSIGVGAAAPGTTGALAASYATLTGRTGGATLNVSAPAGQDPDINAQNGEGYSLQLRPSGLQLNTPSTENVTPNSQNGDFIIGNTTSTTAANAGMVTELAFSAYNASGHTGFLGGKLGVQYQSPATNEYTDMYVDLTGPSGLTEAMRIKANGYVGVGTTAPAAPLDVNGTIHATQYGTVPVGSACPGTSWAAACATSTPGTGVLTPGASISFDINTFSQTGGNVGMVTVFLGYDQATSSATTDNSWVVGIHGHGPGYNQYTPIASRAGTNYTISFSAITTFTNNSSSNARYIIRDMPLVVNAPAMLAQ